MFDSTMASFCSKLHHAVISGVLESTYCGVRTKMISGMTIQELIIALVPPMNSWKVPGIMKRFSGFLKRLQQ